MGADWQVPGRPLPWPGCCSAPIAIILQGKFTVLPCFHAGSFNHGHLITACRRTSRIHFQGCGCRTCSPGYSKIWKHDSVVIASATHRMTAPYSGLTGSDQEWGLGTPRASATRGEPCGPRGCSQSPQQGVPLAVLQGRKVTRSNFHLTSV